MSNVSLGMTYYPLMGVQILVTSSIFLPARRYASAGISRHRVSVRLLICPSVCHTPVLCQNG